ncbi:hypothetical protein HYALB_00008504 [Hymenoscyphus albidus]|uniref:VWFA domain-containing protein n=1 Tax=Hymenoscyphus albidus TaxID=595503 RepID=A0A9N9LUU2_9HELO|nr:hypothetical protein HYALB_00008504 [Hymenoscyphus albidus]
MADLPGDPESDLGVISVSSLSSTNPDSLHVFVLLPNGRKLVISLSRNATIHDLQVETLRRGEKYGVTATLSETTLESTGFDKITFYDGEDLVADILDLTEGSTFTLEILTPQDTISVPPSLDQAVPIQDKGIFVRWITLELAITNCSLSNIPIDGTPFLIDTTLNDFYRHALSRHSAPGIKLFLGECFLHTESNQLTLASLEIDTTKPLNVFVEVVDQQPRNGIIAKAIDPKETWEFKSTKRGFSKFVTSIQMLVNEIKSGRCNMDSILDVLLELTHFPPLILAFKAVYEATRYGIHRAPVGPLLLIATAMQLLCHRIVPESFLSGMDSALEASRQILFWIYSKRSETTISQGRYQSLLRSVEIVEKPVIVPGYEGLLPPPKFGPFTEVVISPTTTYLVSIPDNNEGLSRRLGFASSGLESKTSFYFHPPESWQNLLGHERMPHRKFDEKEFRSLIEQTNLKHPFRMVGPLQPGRCLAAELPVITLSAKGYVCSYEQEDGSCGERVSFTWSVYEGRSMLPDNGGGEFLSQKLEPIIQERKQHQNWKLEAWSEWTRIANFGPPNEAIVICVDNSLSMRTTIPPGWTRYRSSLGAEPSRLDEVKDFFKNLAFRISSLDLPTYLGLVTFSSYTKTLQALSPVVLNFNESLDEVKPGGSTAIFDALASAYTMLAEFLLQHPTKKCRIILLTDGEDTRSVAKHASLARDLYNKNIVLDTIVVGTNKTTELFKISAHTGGYAFAPFTRQMLYQIFLLETMVDIRTRPDSARMKLENWESFRPKLPDMTSLYNFPPCKPHENMNDEFFLLDEAERRIANLDLEA